MKWPGKTPLFTKAMDKIKNSCKKIKPGIVQDKLVK